MFITEVLENHEIYYKTQNQLDMSYLGQELVTFPEHLSSSPVFSEVRVARSLVFFVVIWRSLFVLFLLAIVFAVLL
jgi:hypothetical protein